MYELLGCPMHFGGCDSGLKKSLDEINLFLQDFAVRQIEEVDCKCISSPHLKNLDGVVQTCMRISKQISAVMKAGRAPLFVGGDHTVSIGTVAAAAQSCEKLGLIWVDAHANCFTDETSRTGMIHGMVLAALLGVGNETLTNACGLSPILMPEQVAVFGLRDVDSCEQALLKRLNIKWYSYAHVMELGIEEALAEVRDYMRGTQKLHISFDLDAMNPSIIQGVTTPVKDGFDEVDVFRIFDYLMRRFTISSIDVVDYNPAYDKDGHTVEFAGTLLRKIRNTQI